MMLLFTSCGEEFALDTVREFSQGYLVWSSFSDDMNLQTSHSEHIPADGILSFTPSGILSYNARVLKTNERFTRLELDGLSTVFQQMHIGDHWQVYIPHRLGIGERSNAIPVIPAYSNLICDVMLVGYKSR